MVKDALVLSALCDVLTVGIMRGSDRWLKKKLHNKGGARKEKGADGFVASEDCEVCWENR